MFAITVAGLNLSSVPRLFDFTLEQEVYTVGHVIANRTSIPLVACTLAHGSSKNGQFQDLNASGSLCPPLGQELTVQGKATSAIEKTFRLLVTRCSTADPTCMDNATFSIIEAAMGGTFPLVIPMLATNVNAKSMKYKELYTGDDNVFYMTSQLGVIATASIQ